MSDICQTDTFCSLCLTKQALTVTASSFRLVREFSESRSIQKRTCDLHEHADVQKGFNFKHKLWTLLMVFSYLLYDYFHSVIPIKAAFCNIVG